MVLIVVECGIGTIGEYDTCTSIFVSGFAHGRVGRIARVNAFEVMFRVVRY